MLKLTYTKDFDFKKIKKYKYVIGLLLATTVAAYSNTLDVPEPPPEPIIITIPGEIPDPIIIIPECDKCPDSIICPDPIICEKCPESPIVITPDIVPEPKQPAWYLSGDGKDDKSTDNNSNDDDTDDPDDTDGHGQDHGGHGGHGQGHGYGHDRK